MSVQLSIDDGNPWYLSPDIWVVPGADPSGPQGVPSAGESSYVWARVHNRGTDAVTNAAVSFSWADPSTTITGNTAILIGTSFVDLDVGQTADVLCLTPWTPTWVNGGHECLIAEVVSSADPPPPRTPDDPFDPPGERQMAQRNLNLVASSSRLLVFPFLAGNAKVLRAEEIIVGVRRTPVGLLRPVLQSLGLEHLPAEMDQGNEFGVRPYVCGEHIDDVGKHELSLRLPSGRRQNLALAVRLPASDPGSGGLFLIEERVGDRIVGGVGVLVVVGAAPGAPTTAGV